MDLSYVWTPVAAMAAELFDFVVSRLGLEPRALALKDQIERFV